MRIRDRISVRRTGKQFASALTESGSVLEAVEQQRQSQFEAEPRHLREAIALRKVSMD